MTHCQIKLFSCAFLSHALLCLAVAGCGHSGARSCPLDEPLAKSSLQRFLDAWKAGQQPNDLKLGEPSIIAVDPDWNRGQKLLAYQIVAPQRSDGTNLHTSVDVTLADAKGRSSKQTIDYVIGTRPVITIFRP